MMGHPPCWASADFDPGGAESADLGRSSAVPRPRFGIENGWMKYVNSHQVISICMYICMYVCMYVSIYLSIYLSVYLSIYLSIYLSNLSIYLYNIYIYVIYHVYIMCIYNVYI